MLSIIVLVVRFVAATLVLAHAAPNPTGCGNQGIQWALYKNDQGPNPGGFYSDFSPERFKNITPIYQSTYGSVGGFRYTSKTASQIKIYNSNRTFFSNNIVINHRFYFFPPSTNTYTITIATPDDIGILWLRDNAYSGWLRANDEADCTKDTGSCTSFNVPMSKGQYYPMRVVYGQTTGTAGFGFSIVDGDGNLVLNSNTPNSPNLVPYSCDGKAPMFEPFGAET